MFESFCVLFLPKFNLYEVSIFIRHCLIESNIFPQQGGESFFLCLYTEQQKKHIFCTFGIVYKLGLDTDLMICTVSLMY